MSDNQSTAPDSFAQIAWEDGDTPLSLRFEDPYFAREDGRAETQYVFIAGNGLPERWQQRDTFAIAELGFGTGLNFFETVAAFQSAPGSCRSLTYTSFERFPMTADDLARSLRPWPELRDNLEHLLRHWPPTRDARQFHLSFGSVTLELYLGDANELLPEWHGTADAWFLDGFSPAKNADLWSLELMTEVHGKTVNGGTFSTYTAAGWVRRNLVAAGFEVSKVPGYGRKRERLAGRRPIVSVP